MSHWTEFPPEWWNERRRRDYYIDDEGEVKLDVESETGRSVCRQLEKVAFEIALEATPANAMTRQ